MPPPITTTSAAGGRVSVVSIKSSGAGIEVSLLRQG
jgi:hypothetical protein